MEKMQNHRKIFINGHGWSGSSAMIDLLSNSSNRNYCVIPGEFDDFRVPGTMRSTIETLNPPVSHRYPTQRRMLQYLVRSCIPDNFWPKQFPGQNISRNSAWNSFYAYRMEKYFLKTYGTKVLKADHTECKEQLLRLWLESICELYCQKNKEKVAIFEQFFLFDDDPNIYKWMEFDKLVIFIRRPSYQLNATLESPILYSNYPWQAEFLIGTHGSSKLRKIETFIDTTIKRYRWILAFLNNFEKNKVIFVEFENFLSNFSKITSILSEELNIDLDQNIRKFNLEDSIARNKKWLHESDIIHEKLKNAEHEYSLFKLNIQKEYKIL